MVIYSNSVNERIKRTLKSLNYDHRISCDLIKDYADLQNSSTREHVLNLETTAKQEALRQQIEASLRDSVEATKRLQTLISEVGGNSLCTGTYISLSDVLTLWKNDVALRIVLFNQLRTCDEQDFQRLLRIWLDSPYTTKLKFLSD
ncbi:uncharacterized protein BBOV_IV001325 [Babesia bovis T2Bo]|uniref:uncharacterized protein n=1 Tax=Babesia bovis T2Bo TaxID=484906 RepID=UPI001DA406B7|nr:uncharacterized protein BBOV_IV001325 [Babesia bovis T2Bo]KAG6439888.1 hypothetical protein BBOV_IV001325 [Babesia bovis T2Bo]